MTGINEDYLDGLSSDNNDIRKDVDISSTYQICISVHSTETAMTDKIAKSVMNKVSYILESSGDIDVLNVDFCTLSDKSNNLDDHQYLFTLYGKTSIKNAIRICHSLMSSKAYAFSVFDIYDGHLRRLNYKEVSPQFVHLIHHLTDEKHTDIFNWLRNNLSVIQKYTKFYHRDDFGFTTDDPYVNIEHIYNNIDDYIKECNLPEDEAKSNLVASWRDCLSENSWTDNTIGCIYGDYCPVNYDEVEYDQPCIITVFEDDIHYFNMFEENGKIVAQTTL